MTNEELISALKNANSNLMNPEQLGRVVRETWVRWAKTQPDCKEDWIDPWEVLPERIKDVDIQIGQAVELTVRLYIAAFLGSPVNDQ